jgi:hypothetical protein
MGNEVFVHFDIGAVPMTARVPADQLQALPGAARGSSHTFHLQMAACHLFHSRDRGPPVLKRRQALAMGAAALAAPWVHAQVPKALRFAWWGGAARHAATLKAIALFEQRNPA